MVFIRKLMFLKYSCQEPVRKNCGKPVFLEEFQASLHFNKIPKFLKQVLQTYSEIYFFLCATKKVLQKWLAKIDLKVPGKSSDDIDDDVMKFIL